MTTAGSPDEVSLTLLASGLGLPESPRWFKNKLWFSDHYKRRVMTVDLSGKTELIAEFDDRPSGLGFLPDGTPIVVLMNRRQVVRLENGVTKLHSDLSQLPGHHLNDMIVDDRGRAYVDLLVAPMHHGPLRPGESLQAVDCLALVDPAGHAEVVADGLASPNGLAISADRLQLFVAETLACKITTFRISEHDGKLSDRALHGPTGDTIPDGICLDADGAVWVAGPNTHDCTRLLPSGSIDYSISAGEKQVIACTLGGDDRRTLFLTNVIATWESHKREEADGSIEAVRVITPGAGLP